MKFKCVIVIAFVCCLLHAESFVIEKKKSKQPSKRAVKEQYAQSCGDCIKKVPEVQKHLAKTQQLFINDLNALLDDNKQHKISMLSKEAMEERRTKIVQLSRELEKIDSQLQTVYDELML